MKVSTIFTAVTGIVIAVNAAPKPKPAPKKTTTPQRAAEIYTFTDSKCTAAVGGVRINAGSCYVVAQPSFAIVSVNEVVGDTANCTVSSHTVLDCSDGAEMVLEEDVCYPGVRGGGTTAAISAKC